MTRKIKFDEVVEFVKTCSPETKVYIGSDSQRYKRKGEWFARYSLVVVIHKDGNKGCKIFGEDIHERDYTTNKKNPSVRLMTEAYKVVELYTKFVKALEEAVDNEKDVKQAEMLLNVLQEIEIHVDLNPDKEHASNAVVTQALGYIKGITGIDAKIKPEALAASYAADNFTNISNLPVDKIATVH